MFSIGLVITLVIYGFGDIILELIYDDGLVNQYVLVFKILGVIAIFASLNMMLVSLYFTAVKLYKSRMQILIITGLFHLPLSLLLVKLYGIYGMATAVLITEFFLLVIAFYFFKKHISKKLLID